MIDNFDIIKPLLQFDNPGDCYFIQLLKRHKDNPGMTRNMVNVDNFFVYSIDDYINMKPRIIESAIAHNARAYIRVNRRNTEKLALQTLVQVSNLILSKDYKSVKNAYLKAAGQYNSEPVKRWIVDIDLPENDAIIAMENENIIIRAINELHADYNESGKKDKYKVLMTIPTKNGFHIITNPFNVQNFRKMFPLSIDIHKDNPTILYHPCQ